jgi:hypothetical protein
MIKRDGREIDILAVLADVDGGRQKCGVFFIILPWTMDL